MTTDRTVGPLLDRVPSLPVMPPLADQLLALALAADTDLGELLDLVERDPVLCALVLRLVNSAAAGIPREITSLTRSVVLLGPAHVASLALAAAMGGVLPPDLGANRWQHGFAVACAARAVAEHIAPQLTETAFAAGMLHDIGTLIVSALAGGHVPTAAEPQMRMLLEYNAVGADHAQLGAALAERWRLPAALVEAISQHHDPRCFHDPARRLAAIIVTGEAVADELCGTSDCGSADPVALVAALPVRDPVGAVEHARETVRAHLAASDGYISTGSPPCLR